MTTEQNSRNMVAQIYSDIRHRIIDGVYREGERLPTENMLAERFATSRPTVREALAHLREEGVVLTQHGSGMRVMRRPSPVAPPFEAPKTFSDIRRCYEYRISLEAGIASLAAQNADEADIAAIRKEWDSAQSAGSASDAGLDHDFAFHSAVVRASKNRFLTSALQSARQQMIVSMCLGRNLSQTKSVVRAHAVQQEHFEVLDAIQARDRFRAESAMRDHLERAVSRIFGA